MDYRAITKHVETTIIGRVANKVGGRRTDSVEILLEFVDIAGDGNYLEIGTLFGGSAISVAVLKQSLNHKGFVFCVDPLDGYYRKYHLGDSEVDLQSGKPVTVDTLFENISKFDVQNRVFVMRSYSDDCPHFYGIEFVVSYIDGDHHNGVPLRDWEWVKDCTSKYVVFDNYDSFHPQVRFACETASKDPDWKMAYQEDITFVLERKDEL